MITTEIDGYPISYCPETGKLICAINSRKKKIGEPIGWVKDGYIKIMINKKIYQAHRVAWFCFYG